MQEVTTTSHSVSEPETSNLFSETTDEFLYETETVFFCVTPNNPLRRFCIWLLRQWWFVAFIIICILVNTGMMGAYDPLNLDAPPNVALNVAENVFLAIFAAECIIKIIAMGLIGHPGAYFRDAWNYLDFGVVIISILAVVPSVGANLSALRALRLLRSLRALRFVPQLKLLIETLVKAGPFIGNALILLGIVYLMFAIIGLQVFLGKLRQHCVNPADGSFDTESCCSLETNGQGYQCPPPLQCQVTSLNPRYDQISFDNFLLSFLTVYQIISPENWSVIAELCMQATSGAAIIFFVFMLITGTFLLVNLFVAVVSGVLNARAERQEKQIARGRLQNGVTAKILQFKEWLRNKENQRYDKSAFFRAMKMLANSMVFKVICIVMIFLNFIALIIEFYPEPQAMSEALDIANIVFNAWFTLEIIVKWLGFGFYVWGQDGMNWVDLVVTIGGWIEIGVGGVTFIRTVRTLRLFRLLAIWPSFDKILRTAGRATTSSLWFLLLLLLYLYVFSVMGMQIFGGKFFFSDSYPRWNFDNLWSSFLAMFLVLTGESWPSVMADGIRAQGWGASLFFVIFLSLGQWIVLNLFLALLLQAFDDDDDDDEEELLIEQAKKKREERNLKRENELKMKVLMRFKAVEEHPEMFMPSPAETSPRPPLSPSGSESRATSQTQLASSKKKVKRVPPYVSLYLFPPSNTFRRNMFDLVNSHSFGIFISASILVSCIIIALENPTWNSIFVWQAIFGTFEMFFFIIFSFEMICKIIAYGFVLHPKSYLRNGWNVLDFIVVLSNLVSIVVGAVAGVELSFLRAARAFRVLKLLSRTEASRLVIRVLIFSLGKVVNVIVFSCGIWTIFAIMATNIFAGQTAYCTDSTVLTQAQCVGTFFDPFTQQDAQRQWVNQVWGSFDNFGLSLKVLFPIVGLSGWNDVMYSCMDAVGQGLQPQRDASSASAIFFVVFIIIGVWFNGNLFVGAIVDTFKEMDKKFRLGGVLATPQERRWMQMQKIMIDASPNSIYRVPTAIWREYAFRFTINKYFTYFMAISVFLNIVIMCMPYYGMSDQYEYALQIANAVFVGIFIVELFLRLAALGFSAYFRDVWNIIDFLIVAFSIIDVVTTFLNVQFFPANVFRVFRAFRLLKLMKWSKSLRDLLHVIALSIPPVANIMLVFVIFMYAFAVIGVAVFGDAQLPAPANFDNFGSALYVLLRIVTGESWESVMYALYNPPNNYLGAPAYFYSFLVIAGMMLLQLVVGSMLETFQDLFLVSKNSLTTASMEEFISAWAKQDPKGTQFIEVFQLPSLLREVKPPLGPGKLPRKDILAFIQRINVRIRKTPDGQDGIFYADLLRALAKFSMPIKVKNQSLVERLEGQWNERYPQLEQQTRLFTMEEYVAAVKIQRAFRHHNAKVKEIKSAMSGLRMMDEVFTMRKLDSVVFKARTSNK